MKKIGDALDGFFETYGILDEKNYLGFVGSWNKIIGQDLACHSRPTDIRGTVLIIAIDHPGWMTRIRFEERKILRKIKHSFPQLGISALGFNLVEKLPKPTAIVKEVQESGQHEENLLKGSEEAVDKLKIFSEKSPDTLNVETVSPAEFLQALKNLKNAMADKSRNNS